MSTKITVSVELDCSLDRAWEAMTNPKHVELWNFASPDWHCPKATNELKEGGKFSYTMAAKDGSFSFDFSGTFSKMESPTQLSYLLDDNRTVNITFEEKNGMTIVNEVFETENENPIELQRTGWQAILNNYKAHAETI